jgi:hypothetical protein
MNLLRFAPESTDHALPIVQFQKLALWINERGKGCRAFHYRRVKFHVWLNCIASDRRPRWVFLRIAVWDKV